MLLLSFSCTRSEYKKRMYYDIIDNFESYPHIVFDYSREELQDIITLLGTYENRGSSGQRLKTLYIRGCCFLQIEKPEEALQCFAKASQIKGFKVEDMKYLGLLNIKLAELFSNSFNHKGGHYLFLSNLYLQCVGFDYLSEKGSLFPDKSLMFIDKGKAYRTNNSSRNYALFLTVFFISLLWTVLYYQKKVNVREKKIEGLCSDFGKYRKNVEPLKELLTTILKTTHLAVDEKEIIKERLSIVDVTAEHSKGRRVLENAINSKNKNIVKNIREDFSEMSDSDYLLFCFSIVGFDASTISVLLDLPSKGAVYTRKYRLKQVIDQSSVPNKKEYLRYLM